MTVILRIFLYLIIFICACWAFLLFAGPKIINNGVKVYFEGRIDLQGVSVSPKLQIKVRQVMIKKPESKETDRSFGLARGVKISWALEGRKPVLKIGTGPVNFSNLISADSAFAVLDFAGPFVWDNVHLKTKFKGLKAKGEFESPELYLEGQLNTSKFVINDLTFQLQNVSGKFVDGIDIETVNGDLAKLELLADFYDQNLQVNLGFKQSRYNDSDWQIPDATVSINTNDGGVYFQVEVEKIDSSNDQLALSQLRADGVYNFRNSIVNGHVNIYFDELLSRDGSLKLTNLTSTIKELGSDAELSLKLDLDNMEISRDGRYLGKLSNSVLDAKIISKSKKEGLKSNLEATIEFEELPDVNIFSASNFFIIGVDRLNHCIFTACEVLNFEGDFTVVAMGEALKGEIFCEKPECYLDESSVRVKTMDTKKFFENLALTRLVNPIVLATFYSQLLSGIPHKLGHSLEF